MQIKDILKSIFITICFIISTQISADTDTTDSNLYQVNIIIFEHISSQALNSEIWLAVTDLPNLENSIEPQLLESEDSQLQIENRRFSRKIAQKNNYKVLLNIAWQQEIPVTQGNLIEYYIAEVENGKKAKLVREKVKLPTEKGEYNIEYYLERQILPAVENIFQVFDINIKQLIDGKKQTTLGDF